jgi:multimeric flavodoxin WrbA
VKIGKKALLLVGSPKGPGSTSKSLGTFLLDHLHEKGFETERIYVYPSVKDERGHENLFSAIDHSDILILAFPLYVDSLPSPVIGALEIIAEHRREMDKPKRQSFVAICNCGFPETHQTETALAICRRFALETGMEWAGGLGLGMGAAIDGKPLEKLGFMTRNVRKSLKLTANALASGNPVPQEALDLMAKPFMPIWLYLWFGNLGWRRQARKNGVLDKIKARPYQKTE